MKINLKYIFAGLLTLGLTVSCSDDQLETSPTTAVSGSAISGSADNAMIALNGIYRSMYTAGWSTSGNTHQCFGISAYNLMADVMGDDMIMDNMGSGWFWFDAIYNVKARYTSSAWRSYDLWSADYTWIQNANYVIKNDSTMNANDVNMKYAVGQAYAVRAYGYFMLAQQFARTYKGHESEPCVPIYTEPTTNKTDGKPRATVQEVYSQITKDINKAVVYLQASEDKTTLTKDKSYLGLYAALGLKARIALTMEDWATAASAAEQVINSGKYTIQDVKASAFQENTQNFCNTASSENVIWAASINSDQAGQYASFFSHMDEVQAYGQRAHKQITKSLYNSMASNDTRRCWWDPKNENNTTDDNGNVTSGYQQEKFKYSNKTSWLGDYVWMRVEEMYLTAAEAECMLGNDAKAQELLTTFMKHRQPDYKCTKTGTAMGTLTSDKTGSLREEIIKQRRIELWGEYGRIYDIRRLKQGFTRTTANGWPNDPSILLTGRKATDPESYMWVLTIPQSEFDGNVNMDASKDQNPTGDVK